MITVTGPASTQNYVFSYETGELEVTPRDVTVTITGHKDSPTYSGSEQSVEGYDVEISDDLYTEDDFTFSGEAVAKGTDAGKYPMGLSEDQFTNNNENFNVTFVVTDGELDIQKASLTIIANKQTYIFNGQIQGEGDTTYADAAEIAEKVTVEGLKGSDEITSITLDGQGQDVGEYPIVPSAAEIGDATDNYEIEYVNGILEITKQKVTVTITGNNGGEPYTGEEQKVEGYTVEISNPDLYTEDDFTFSGEAVAKGTDAGEYPMNLDKDQFTNINDNFDVTFAVTDGKLTIEPANIEDPEDPGKPNTDRFEVSQPEDVVYNGEEQKQPVSITDKKTGKELVEGTDYEITYSEDTTNVGVVTVTITGKGNYEGAFEVTYKITPREITLRSASAEKVYDGTPLTKDQVDIVAGKLADRDKDALTYNVTGSQTYVGSSDNTFTYSWKDEAAEEIQTSAVSRLRNYFTAYAAESKTAMNYKVKVEYGTLTVTDNGVDPDKVVTKTHQDKAYRVGDTITFTIEATNIYDEVKTITLQEKAGVTLAKSVFPDVAPGATIQTTATYKITEADAKTGTFTNVIKVSFSGESKTFENTDKVTGIRRADGTSGRSGKGPKTGDDGFGYDLTIFFGSAAALIAMLAGRRRKEEENE